MTIPLVPIQWEPIEGGVDLKIHNTNFHLNMISVRELRDDMEEAQMLSRGCEKLEVMTSEVEQYDKIYVGCNVLAVSSVLASKDGTVLQFGDSFAELIMPPDVQITVWRAIQ